MRTGNHGSLAECVEALQREVARLRELIDEGARAAEARTRETDRKRTKKARTA